MLHLEHSILSGLYQKQKIQKQHRSQEMDLQNKVWLASVLTIEKTLHENLYSNKCVFYELIGERNERNAFTDAVLQGQYGHAIFQNVH